MRYPEFRKLVYGPYAIFFAYYYLFFLLPYSAKGAPCRATIRNAEFSHPDLVGQEQFQEMSPFFSNHINLFFLVDIAAILPAFPILTQSG
jgi:hypothetical protein